MATSQKQFSMENIMIQTDTKMQTSKSNYDSVEHTKSDYILTFNPMTD